jgi:hypothetical protein
MGELMALALLCTMMAAVLFQPALMGPPRSRMTHREPTFEFEVEELADAGASRTDQPVGEAVDR